MRRNTLAVAVAAIGAMTLPGVLSAQTPRHQGVEMGLRGEAPVERIIAQRAELGLTDAQVTQLREIEAQLEEQNRPLIEQLQAAREKVRAERPQPTAEQREQREQMRERRSAMTDSMRSRARELTPEQREQLRERMQQRRAEGDSAQRPRATRQVRPTPAIPAELKPVIEQLRANTASAMQRIQSTLTPEQQQKLRELRPVMRHRGEPGADRALRPERRRTQGARAPRGAS